jgi:hypothetical protein
MVHVTETEIEAYLQSPFLPPNGVPPELESSMSKYWASADALARQIAERRKSTPPEVVLRLERLKALCQLSNAEYDVLLLCLLPELEPRYH